MPGSSRAGQRGSGGGGLNRISKTDPIVIHAGAANVASSATIAADETDLCGAWRFRRNTQDQILVAHTGDLLESSMYAFLETIWPFSAPSTEPCGATEVDVSGLIGMSLLEWLGEPGRECTDDGRRRHLAS